MPKLCLNYQIIDTIVTDDASNLKLPMILPIEVLEAVKE